MNCFTGYMKVAGCSELKIERTGSWMTCIHNYEHDAPLSISNHTLAPLYASTPLSYMSTPPPPPFPFYKTLSEIPCSCFCVLLPPRGHCGPQPKHCPRSQNLTSFSNVSFYLVFCVARWESQFFANTFLLVLLGGLCILLWLKFSTMCEFLAMQGSVYSLKPAHGGHSWGLHGLY